MPFAYFDRLTRRQQGIYLRSDKITGVPLPGAVAMRPLVAELGAALESGDRDMTESASQLLAGEMARALHLPRVRVMVLAARPHARWGELHGLYETAKRPGAPPTITLWMRTAIDYTLLRLDDSLHTQGFYQRESHLFHQLVTDGGHGMATLEEQMARMERTAEDLAAAVKGVSDTALSKRPDEKNWSAKEVVCHLRDAEEAFLSRFQSIMAMDEPKFPAADPDRTAIERQYARNDAQKAVESFKGRRVETLAFLRELKPEQWERGGVHPARGRMTMKDFVGLMAWHDDNHLDQIKRALDGKP